MNNSIVSHQPLRPVCRATLLALSLAVIAFLTSPQGAQAAIYKWVDENGKVHYSDKAPTDDTPQMDIAAGLASTGPTLTDTQRKEKQRKVLDAFEKERNDKEAAAGAVVKEKKERKVWCLRANEELAQFRAAGYLYDYDEDGNKVVFSHEQRAVAEKDYEKRIKKLC